MLKLKELYIFIKKILYEGYKIEFKIYINCRIV